MKKEGSATFAKGGKKTFSFKKRMLTVEAEVDKLTKEDFCFGDVAAPVRGRFHVVVIARGFYS